MQVCPSCNTAGRVESLGSQVTCLQCGLVLEESAIVSDVTFAENSAGGAVVQGSYVGNEQRGVRTQGPGGFRSGGAGASREETVARAKHQIRALGMGKKVPQNVIEKAARLFNLALEGGTYRSDGQEPINFVLGRKSEYTQASCLYVACRLEKTNHMLIDFADAINVNVFILGRSYLRLVRCLGFRLPVIDPSIYISRFASLLDFGDETQRVAMDATRLVKRFKKDWITDGRRPAGVCGACLLIAARMNNFRRSIAEIIQVVKIADVTLRKRLEEFQNTASSKLTIDDFRNIWLEEETEPPAYYLARMPKKDKRKVNGERAVKRLKGDKHSTVEGDEDDDDGNEADDEDQNREKENDDGDIPIDPRLEALAEEATRAEIAEYLDDEAAKDLQNPDRHNTAAASTSTSTSTQAVSKGTVAKPEEEDDFADLDDEELDAFINSEAEVKIKERVWIEFNKDYLERMLERQLKEEADIKAGIKPVHSRAKRRSSKARGSSTAPATAAESAKQMMRKRNFSRRINYDAITSLLDDPKSGVGKAKRNESDEEEIEEEGDELAGDVARRKRKAMEQSGHESETDRATNPYTDAETDNDEGDDNWRIGLPGLRGLASGADDDDLYEGEGDGIFD